MHFEGKTFFYPLTCSVVKVSKLKARRMSAEVQNYDLKVWLKSSAWDMKKRMDITARLGNDKKKDFEKEIYATIMQDVKVYISKKQIPATQYLPIPEYFHVCINEEEGKCGKSLFLLENPIEAGFSPCSIDTGLDYEQSVLVISTLARYHATIFCYRHDVLQAEVYILHKISQSGVKI